MYIILNQESSSIVSAGTFGRLLKTPVYDTCLENMMYFWRLYRFLQGALLLSLHCLLAFGHRYGQVQLREVLEAWDFRARGGRVQCSGLQPTPILRCPRCYKPLTQQIKSPTLIICRFNMPFCTVCPNNGVRDTGLCCSQQECAHGAKGNTFGCTYLGAALFYTCTPFHLGLYKALLATKVIAFHSQLDYTYF